MFAIYLKILFAILLDLNNYFQDSCHTAEINMFLKIYQINAKCTTMRLSLRETILNNVNANDVVYI